MLKIDLNEFVGKDLDLGFLAQKRLEMGPKLVFSSYIKNQCVKFFWFFAWNNSSIKTYNWVLNVFWGKNFCLKVLGPKCCYRGFWAKMSQAQVIWKIHGWTFWINYSKVAATQSLETVWSSWEKSCLQVFRRKCLFCIKLQWDKGLRWLELLFWEKFWFEVFRPEMAPKLNFWSFIILKLMHGIFLIFTWNYNSLKILTWLKWVLGKRFLFWSFWAKRGPKCAKDRLSSSMKSQMEHFYFFA